jgi:hypothetical protein
LKKERGERDFFFSFFFFLRRSLMELQKRPDHHNLPEKKGQKRKLEQEEEEFQQQISLPPTGETRDALLSDINQHVSILLSTFSSKESDRASAKRATHALADLAKNG